MRSPQLLELANERVDPGSPGIDAAILRNSSQRTDEPSKQSDERTAVIVRPDVELQLTAQPENVAVVRHVFAGMGDALGMDAESLGRLRLALSEACTNVVVHAYEDGVLGALEVEAAVDDRLLHVVVRDRGIGLRPRPDSPGLGMGLPLIAAITDQVEIVGDKEQGNEVRMTFTLPESASRAGSAA
jgi:anti-sigma regulatory factor (Ser/Thr protein kinase)